MRRLRVPILLSLLAAACGPVPTPSSAAGGDPIPEDICVMQVPGAGLDSGNIEDGYEMTFTTVDPSSLPTLRRAVQVLAAAYAQGARDHVHHHEGADHPPEEHYLYQGFEDARVEVVPVDQGARIELHSADGASVEAIRERARIEARMMRRGACPLLPPELEPLPMGS